MAERFGGKTETGWSVGLALLAGALLRAAFVLHHPKIAGDALVYGDLAHNLLTHHVFGLTEDRVRPTLIRLPGYPLFLAACFALFGTGRYVAALWLQVPIDLCSCVLVAQITRRLWGRRAGLGALWLASLCPFTANYTAVAITETLSVFCVAMALWGLERWLQPLRAGRALWAAMIGVALAGAVLLRPDQGLLAVAVLPAMAWSAWRSWRFLRLSRRKPDRALTQVGGEWSVLLTIFLFALPLLIWSARNWRVFHVVQPLAPRYANDPDERVSYGFQRWYRTWAVEFQSSLDTYWRYDGDALRLGDLPDRAFDNAAQKRETAAIYRRYNETQAASPEVDAAFAKLAAKRVRAQPLRYYVVLPVGKVLDMWLRPRTESMKLPVRWWRWRADRAGSALASGYALLNGAYVVLGVFGVWRWWRVGRGRGEALVWVMLGFVLLRSALLLTVDNSEPRYTLECFPVLFALGGVVWGRFLGEKVRGVHRGALAE